MEDSGQKTTTETERKAKIRRKYRGCDTDDITVIPAAEAVGLFEDTGHKRVAVYARVSTDSENQTSSYELQKNYYEAMVEKHPNRYRPNHIKGSSFCPIIYGLNNWKPEYKFTLSGYVKEQSGERVLLFYADEPEIRVRDDDENERIMFKAEWEDRFGDYYHEYLAKSESVFDPETEWSVNAPGVTVQTPDFKIKKEQEIETELKALLKELEHKGGVTVG